MRIIDLLNKIANGEEVPKKIKYKNKIYEWKEYDAWYGKIMTKKGWVKEHGYVAEENRTYFYLKHCYQDLNDTVEILEEEKKIPEKLENRARFQYSQLPSWLDKKEIIKTINENFEKHQKAIYEIIDYLDYLKSKGE